MLIAGLVLSSMAALVHVYIFYLESIAWGSPRARATFGTSTAEASAAKSLAFNQGFYNLFLAVAVALGVILIGTGEPTVGMTLVFVGTGSMAAAAIVLFLSAPDKHSAAIKQGLLPLLAIVLVAIGQAV